MKTPPGSFAYKDGWKDGWKAGQQDALPDALRWLHDNVLTGTRDPRRSSAVELVADLFGLEIGDVIWRAERVNRPTRRLSIGEVRRSKLNPSQEK